MTCHKEILVLERQLSHELMLKSFKLQNHPQLSRDGLYGDGDEVLETIENVVYNIIIIL